MAITRLSFITVAELNDVLNTVYPVDDNTNQLIIEASEYIDYYTGNLANSVITTNTEDERINYIKLATAYQVQFNDYNNDIDLSNDVNSHNLGRYSTGGSSSGGTVIITEESKMSPRTLRYLGIQGANIIDRSLTGNVSYGGNNLIC